LAQTIAEKLLSERVGRAVEAGDIVVVPVDGAMATDATAPFALQAFERMGGERVWDPERFSLVIDHATPAPNERISTLHTVMRRFAREQGVRLYDVGEGICHQLMVENGHVRTGELFVGADSHTPTYGALGAFAVGVGSTDLAGVLLTGKIWLKVPRSVRIELTGTLPEGVSAKDVVLYLVGRLGIAGATYEAVEFAGEAVTSMSLASRMVLANMVSEMGAKTALVETDGLRLPGGAGAPVLRADPGARYRREVTVDVSGLRPQVAVPHSPDNVRDIDEVLGTKVDMAFIGSCTNSRLEDLHAAARVLAGRRLAPGVRLIVTAASRHVFNQALADGTVQALSDAGATFITSGCGPCVGTHQGVPGDGETVISSTNRNFRGRMGNPNASIYLASPAVVAAAAAAGEIVDPATLPLAGEGRVA
jgi:3-isopropylmalate/(R)-2-methylmalate dehydratase large subunit